MTIRRLLCTLLAAAAFLSLAACGTTDPAPAETTAAPVTTAAPATTAPPETTAAPETEPVPTVDVDALPRTVYGGAWDTSHVQGIAVDLEKGFMYFSFTTVFVKTDLQGNIVGTLTGLTGHLGDLDLNPDDGRVYGSLELKNLNTFYLAVIDVDKIDREGISALNNDIFHVVALPDVSADFTATVGGKQYRYGCSGIDGVAFGPDFGAAPDSPARLMVAYGIFKDNNRSDNDYQVILSYDMEEFVKHEKRFMPRRPDTDGPTATARYFVYTGNTNYGVQNLEYDPATGYWLLAAYTGAKAAFPNYALFAVDGSIAPVEGDILGQPAPEKGLLLTLADAGLKHGATGIRGWHFGHADTGIAALGDGYFYISHDSKTNGKQDCTATLYRWTGEENPFEKVESFVQPR